MIFVVEVRGVIFVFSDLLAVQINMACGPTLHSAGATRIKFSNDATGKVLKIVGGRRHTCSRPMHAATQCVIRVSGGTAAVYRDEPVFGIVGISMASILRHISSGVVLVRRANVDAYCKIIAAEQGKVLGKLNYEKHRTTPTRPDPVDGVRFRMSFKPEIERGLVMCCKWDVRLV